MSKVHGKKHFLVSWIKSETKFNESFEESDDVGSLIYLPLLQE